MYDLYSNFRTVAGNYTTLPEWFKSNGFKTIGMGKIFHPGHASGAGAGAAGSGMGGGDDLCCSWSNTSFYFHAPNLQYWSGTSNETGTGGRSWMCVPHYGVADAYSTTRADEIFRGSDVHCSVCKC